MLTSLHLRKKSSEVCIKIRLTSASISIQGQDTKHTTVKWPICSMLGRTIYPITEQLGTPLKLKQKMKHLLSFAHVLSKP